jgi:hypothetical protein
VTLKASLEKATKSHSESAVVEVLERGRTAANVVARNKKVVRSRRNIFVL